MWTYKIKDLVTGQVFRNISWLGTSELINRVFRVGVTFTLSRLLSPTEYGLMAIIYIAADFSIIFIRNGIAAKIVQASEEELKSVCDTAYWVNWITCLFAFSVQCLIAYPVARFYGNTDLFLPLCVASLTYLIFPFFLVKASLIERNNRMKELAFFSSAQSIAASVLVIILVLAGLGIWSISISMVLATLVWTSINLRDTSWSFPKKISFHGWKAIAKFSKNTLGVELLMRVRHNLDYLIVGKFLGLENLGLYYFAFNAGSGITMNVVSTFVWALYPHLCRLRDDAVLFKREYYRYLRVIVLTVSLVVFLQTSLAYFYVPIVFGTEWIPAIPILILICLSVIPVSMKMAGSILLNADDKPEFTLNFDVFYTVIFTLFILVAVHFGIYWVAFAVLLCNLVMGVLFSILASRRVFGWSRS